MLNNLLYSLNIFIPITHGYQFSSLKKLGQVLSITF